MAAVIRYLSADNHIADTPPFNDPETGPRRATVRLFERSSVSAPALHFCIYRIITGFVPESVFGVIIERVPASSKKYPHSSVFLIYIYIAFTCPLSPVKNIISCQWKTESGGTFPQHTLTQSLINRTAARKSFGPLYHHTVSVMLRKEQHILSGEHRHSLHLFTLVGLSI